MAGLTSRDNSTFLFFLGEIWPLIELTLFVWQTLSKQAMTATVSHYRHPETVSAPNHFLPLLRLAQRPPPYLCLSHPSHSCRCFAVLGIFRTWMIKIFI